MNIIKLSEADGSWKRFREDWQAQCEAFDEDFSSYAEGTFSVVSELATGASDPKNGLFAIEDEGQFSSMFQSNLAAIPGPYTGPVLRIRFLTLSPKHDFGDISVEKYAETLLKSFAGVLHLSDNEMSSKYINFHLRSPADRPFFASLGKGLNKLEQFSSVKTRGAWLFVEKA